MASSSINRIERLVLCIVKIVCGRGGIIAQQNSSLERLKLRGKFYRGVRGIRQGKELPCIAQQNSSIVGQNRAGNSMRAHKSWCPSYSPGERSPFIGQISAGNIT